MNAGAPALLHPRYLNRPVLGIPRWGNRQHHADWLDPESILVSINIARHHFSQRAVQGWTALEQRRSSYRVELRLDEKR